MPAHLYIAEAAAGKTAYVLALAREAAGTGHFTPRVVVPTYLQAHAFRYRLAQTGGALGIRVLTFDGLVVECLDTAATAYTELSDPVCYRLLRMVTDDLPLRHYVSLTGRSGFIRVLERLVAELKAGMIAPEDFSCAVAGLGDEPRLQELANIYAAYQVRLQAQGWADRAGLAWGWLAVEVLDAYPALGRDWPLLTVDGFDDFTPVQLALLQRLALRATHTVVTLTARAGLGSG